MAQKSPTLMPGTVGKGDPTSMLESAVGRLRALGYAFVRRESDGGSDDWHLQRAHEAGSNTDAPSPERAGVAGQKSHEVALGAAVRSWVHAQLLVHCGLEEVRLPEERLDGSGGDGDGDDDGDPSHVVAFASPGIQHQVL
jgi:hypothetical protein|eukprot:COSAG01_NODE_12345_length_1755_cov_2.695048_3_plen_140_part_00